MMSLNHKFLAKYGSQKHIEKLVNSDDPKHRAEVATKHPEYHEKLMHDPDLKVREQVAFHAKSKPILDHMVSRNYDHGIMTAIASHGHKDHLDQLVNHLSHIVRSTVAKHKHPDHLDKLVHDSHADVRVDVAEFGQDHHRDKLVHDNDRMVRTTVARFGNNNHHQILKDDPSWSVRRAVANTTNDKSIIEHLKNDKDGAVSSAAKQNKAGN